MYDFDWDNISNHYDCNVITSLKRDFVSSDRSSYGDSVLLLVQQLFQILNISANPNS